MSKCQQSKMRGWSKDLCSWRLCYLFDSWMISIRHLLTINSSKWVTYRPICKLPSPTCKKRLFKIKFHHYKDIKHQLIANRLPKATKSDRFSTRDKFVFSKLAASYFFLRYKKSKLTLILKIKNIFKKHNDRLFKMSTPREFLSLCIHFYKKALLANLIQFICSFQTKSA